MAARGTEATVPSGGEVGRLTLWLAAASGTAAWVVHLVGSYALLPLACATTAWILHAVTIVTLIPTIAGTWVCLQFWRRYRGQAGPDPHGRSADYQQYMGLTGALLNALFLFVIALEGLPVVLMNPCLGLP
jgi:hypothetical protein